MEPSWVACTVLSDVCSRPMVTISSTIQICRLKAKEHQAVLIALDSHSGGRWVANGVGPAEPVFVRGLLGRIREVEESPDGFIYFATSNRDGRGSPDSADDRIFKLVPVP